MKSSMPRRGPAAARLGAVAAAAAGALLLAFLAWPTAPAPTNDVDLPARAVPTPANARATRAVRPQSLEAPLSPDSARIKAAFEKFQASLKDITKERLEAEQVRLKAALEVARSMPTPEPAVEAIVDESGLKWNKLTYPSGEIRYEFPTD
jgi:hypothetical protein